MDPATQDRVNTALASKDWEKVSELLAPLGDTGPHERAMRLARNMAAIHERDPALGAELDACGESGRVAIVRLPDGTPTIGVLGPDGAPSPICSSLTDVAQLNPGLDELARFRAPLGVLGVGDGRLLASLALERPDELGHERAVFVVEPQTELFRAMLVICDLWQPEGVLRSGRFQLLVGRTGEERLARWLDEHAACPPPAATLAARAGTDALRDRLGAMHKAYGERAASLTERVAQSAAGRTAAESAARLAGARPAVMLITTRFSTVLQYSTRDFAEAFRAEGYDAEIVIEETPWDRHTRNARLEAFERIRPDLVFQIDHHRHEAPGLVPEEVPFVCVIQDNLPNLTNRDTASKLGPTDYSTGPWVHRYVREFGYPEERCIELPRLTRVPEGIDSVAPGDGRTVLYVSNHSGTPEQTIERALEVVGKDPTARRLTRAAAEAIVAVYERGGALENASDVLESVRETARSMGLALTTPDALGQLSELLATYVNNALYRQQALGWAAEACESLGLDLVIHGAGWERHPEFARFAAGPIAYGPDLIERTRGAAFSLMLEPFFPTSHQRALDIWMWGGLPLIRSRARDRQQDAFQTWIDRLDDEITSYTEAIGSLDGVDRETFERVYTAQVALDPDAGELDLVELYARRRRTGLGDLMRSPPMIRENSFASASELRACMERLLASPDGRSRIAETQHGWIRDRFSYRAGVRLLMDRLVGQLERTAEGCPA